MTKINVIIPSFYPAIVYGGPIFSSFYLSLELSKLPDICIHVSTTNSNMNSKLNIVTNVKTRIDSDFFVTYYKETITNRLSLSLLINLFKDIHESDVIHIQSVFSVSTPIALLISRILNKRVFLSSRGQLGQWCLNSGNRYKSLWLKLLIKPFVRFLKWHATSTQEKKEILDLFPESRVVVIPNGVYVDIFSTENILSKKDLLNKFSIPNNSSIGKIIISMGRLQKKKGFDILIKSFESVLERYPDSYLLIAGPDEGEKNELVSISKKLNLSSNVYFIGNIENKEKNEFFASADLFALASHNENFGNVFIESLANGTPVIASRNTPWDDVEKFGCGRHVGIDIAEFGEAMLDILLRDRNDLRKKSTKFAIKYDWATVAKRFHDAL